MENLSYEAKIAVIKILDEIMHADNIVHEKEVKYLNDIILLFKLKSGYEIDVKNLMTLQALSIIRTLSFAQKSEIVKMMGNMIIVDNDINYNEVQLYNTFCELCDIDEDFRIEDYPEYMLSGSEILPNDISGICIDEH